MANVFKKEGIYMTRPSPENYSSKYRPPPLLPTIKAWFLLVLGIHVPGKMFFSQLPEHG